MEGSARTTPVSGRTSQVAVTASRWLETVERAGPSHAQVGAVGRAGSEAAMGVCRVVVDQLPVAGAVTSPTGQNGRKPVCATDAAAAAAGRTEEAPS